jgi:DNA primase
MSSKSVEQIKERLPIADVIASYIKLDRAGANFKGRCPFHNEKTPSFMVSPERNSYYCFGCQAKGDVFSFVQEFEKVDFKEALKILADRAGVTLDTYRAPEAQKEDDEKDKLRKIMETATSYFEGELQKDKQSMEYLTDRGLTTDTISEWRLGSTKKGWSNLYDHLKTAGFADVDIDKAGLAKRGEKSGSFYDRFRDRIMFPIFDASGKVIAFTGRFKDWEKEEGKEASAKYLNSPDTVLFDKSRTLYGFHKAKTAISKWKFSMLVEGQMDLLMSQQAGFANTVATSGTALTAPQLEMLSRFSKNLLIAYDGDKAGVEAARRAWSLALELGMDVKIAPITKGQDPADIIKQDPAVFKEIVKKGMHIVEFYLKTLLSRGLSERELGREVESEILPYVKAIASPIDQSHFMTLIAARTGIKEDALMAAFRKTPLPGDMARNVVLPKLPKEKINDTMPAQLHSSKNRLIAGTYLILHDEEKAKAYIENAHEIKDELQFVVEEWLAKSGQSPETYLSDLLKTIEKEKLQSDLKETMNAYLSAEQDGDTAKAAELLKKSDDIRKKLAII